MSGFAVRLVRCAGKHAGWSTLERSEHYAVVLVRSGVFRWRRRGRTELADPALGYLIQPGDETQFAHPAGGDTCSSIVLEAWLWQDVVGERPVGGTMRVDGRLELAHRRLLRAAEDPGFAGTERLSSLLSNGLRLPGPGAANPRLIAEARAAIVADHAEARDLRSLARLLGVSPFHLSRMFSRHTGLTLTRYRNRVRVSRALSRLEQGERDLAGLAAELGFADQAHLTRTVRAEVGQPPGRLARLLSG